MKKLLMAVMLACMASVCDAQELRGSNNAYIGKIEANGTVRASNNSVIGRIGSDGTVRDKTNRVIGYAKGVPATHAAAFFFFKFW